MAALAGPFNLRFQPLEGLQAAQHTGIHQCAQHQAHQAHGQQQLFQQLLRDALAHREALSHLHPQALAGGLAAVVHLQQGHAHGAAVHLCVVQQRLAQRDGLCGRRRQLSVAQQKATWGGRHHVGDAVGGVLLQDVLCGFGKVHQQPIAHRLDLPRERAHRLGQRLVNAFFAVLQRNAPRQKATRQPQHQLGQQQP